MSRLLRRFRYQLLVLVVVSGLVVSAMATGLLPGAGASTSAGLGYDPADVGSMSSITRLVGAQDAWAQGYTGTGVDVAVIDTGVAPVPGLDAPGKVIVGPDLSFDSQAAAPSGSLPPGLDAYGHGTFMAGLIAGRDDGVSSSASNCSSCLNSSGYSDTAAYVGVAPDARIINVKVGAADGAVDVTQVIAAIDWVTQHAHDPGLNIRVISLSYGTDSTQSYLVDPLTQAAEHAWRSGIVVVAAAGNDGKPGRSLADPAVDPFLVAVGADDANGTQDTADDAVASFAQHGMPQRPVDVVAPGTHVIGLRVPGSFVDLLPDNVGTVGARFQRGSGTSQATAIVSGVAALLVQRFPDASPDQIKGLLEGGASALTKNDKGKTKLNPATVHYSGYGIVGAAASLLGDPAQIPAQTGAPATGTGSLEAARGSVHVVSAGVPLTGQRDIFGRPYDSAAMAQSRSASATWSGGSWNAGRWSGDSWPGSRWENGDWVGSRWENGDWVGSRWENGGWVGSRWENGSWVGSRWENGGWNDCRWSTAGWQ